MTPSTESRFPIVAVLGGGLAGMAAATALRQRGFRVTLLEARPSLGGRATSYIDQETGLLIDNCQHVSMGCCTNLTHLCRTLGIAEHFTDEKQLYFVAPEGMITPFAADPLPAPFHLSRAFLKLPYLSFREKRLFARATRALALAAPVSLQGVCFEEWLRAQKQTERLIRHVWEVVLVSALSESLDRIDASYARKVFVDGFLANPQGWRVKIPSVSLDLLYSNLAKQSLEAMGVELRCGQRVATMEMEEERIRAVRFKDGSTMSADEFVLAVPHHQVSAIVPEPLRQSDVVGRLQQMESAPITSLHFWFDREITPLPHAVLVGRLSQWLFNRGPTRFEGAVTATSSASQEINGHEAHLYQVVISASRHLQGLPQSELIDRVCGELREVWPAARDANLLHARLISERRAVFSVTPGIDDLRPGQQSPVSNLQFAGDWTRTGWPATMEGAVRSGYLAAENILRNYGNSEVVVQPELPVSWLSRRLLGIT